jgi:nucleoside-diphosphate-sugar epimerase
VKDLLDKGHSVRCLVRPSSDCGALRDFAEPDSGSRLELRVVDLVDVGPCAGALAGCDVLYHLASELRGSTPVLFLNNVVTTRRLVEAASRTRIPRFVLVSSLGVYGTAQLRPGDVLDESCPLESKPQWRDPYTYSKVAQEEVAWEAYRQAAIPLVVIRPGVIYGPGRDCISARVGLRLGKLLIRMGGKQQLPYVFVENCTDGVLRAGTTPGIEGQAFNLVDDGLVSGREMLARYRATVGRVRTLVIPYGAIDKLSDLCEWYHRRSRGQLPAVLTRYKSAAQWKPLQYSNARAKVALGWPATISFAEGLGRTLAWLSQADRNSVSGSN